MRFSLQGRQAAGLAIVSLVALALPGCAKSRNESEAAVVPAAAAAPASDPAAGLPEGVAKALGRWVRTDGGYVVELSNPEKSGVIQAAYFNPKPIRVSRAIWMQGGEGLQFVVELNDVGYQGSTYVLSYDAATDRLVGKYHQPSAQQTYDIEFVRQKAVPLR